MSINSSSSLNITPILPLHSLISSYYERCLKSTSSTAIFTLYTFIIILFLPLYILILCMGFQRWRNQQSMSHSDCFTYHCATLEVLVVLGSFVYCLGIYARSLTVMMLGMFVSCIVFPGQTLFHLLTCVERYLAVVHPITYMCLRESGGVRIRNISIVCVWLACFAWMGLTKLCLPDFPVVPLICMLGISVTAILFCCLSILCALTQSGPGELSRNAKRVDQSKQRAFHIICAIMGALLFRFAGLLVCCGFSLLRSIRPEDSCAILDSGVLLTMPSSLVLPLLLLYKAGKLACCQRNTQP